MLLDVHFRVCLALATRVPRTIVNGVLGPRDALPPLGRGGILLHGDEAIHWPASPRQERWDTQLASLSTTQQELGRPVELATVKAVDLDCVADFHLELVTEILDLCRCTIIMMAYSASASSD